MRSVSENVMGMTVKVASRIRDGAYDDDLLELTAQLMTLRRDQCEQRRRLLELSAGPLSPRQREELARLIRARRIME